MKRFDLLKNHSKKSNGSLELDENDLEVLLKQIDELEHQLIDSERKSLGLFELTNDALFLIDLEGNYIEVNQRAADMLGYNRQDIIGKPMTEFIVKDEQKNSKERLADLIAGEILPIYRRTFKKRDGSIFPAEINAAIVQDDEGNPAYIQSAVRDISERVEAEQALDKERKAYHLIAEAILYAVDLKDFCERSLSGLTEILGFDSSIIRLFENTSGLLVPIADVELIKEKTNAKLKPESIDNPHEVFSLAARSKRVIISPRFEDRAILAPFKEQLEKKNIYSLIAWPLLDAKKNLLGVLELHSRKHMEIQEEDLIFFETIARMFTVAFERKRAEDALKDSEEKYRSFAQNFQGIAYRITTDLEKIFYDGAIRDITEYLPKELFKENKSWKEIVFEEDLEKYAAEFQNLVTQQCLLIDIEYRIITKNGLVRWVNDIGQTICDEKGKPIWIQGAIYDITEKKRIHEIQAIQRKLGIALAAISNLTDALKLVLESLLQLDVIDSGSIFAVDNETGFLNLIAHSGLSTDYLEKIAYFSTDSLFTQAILSGNAIYADYTQIQKEKDSDLFTKEDIHSIANIPIISDDRIVAVMHLTSHSFGDIPFSTRNALETISSQISGSISRIKAEQAFRESDERYRYFVQNFQGIAYRTKENMHPIFFHGAVEEITGYTNEILLQRNPSWSDIVHPYDKIILEQAVKELKKGKSSGRSIEYRIITKDGQIKWVQDSWQLIYDGDKFLGIQGSIHNVTDRKEAQNQIQQLYLDLEKRVEERTEQLTSINKELTAFSYSVSHDLRTPLRHIGGFADLLQKRVESMKSPDSRITNYTKKIIDSTEEMNELIDGLLTFSRMSRVEMVKIRINLTELVQDVLNDFQVELGNRQVDISVNFLPDVIGDPSLLRLVLVNIISNAFKFTKKKEIAKIEIGTMPSKEPQKATVYIRDNGEGFDMKYYDRLFGVFQRLHKTEDFEGTGIGLATVQRVIRRMGGRIWAEGAVNKGASFYFSIPKAEEENELEDK